MSEASHACVYIISMPDGPQKIGIAANARRRLSGLQTASPAALALHRTFDMPRSEAVAVERYAHWILRAKFSSGEWFTATAEEAVMAVCEAIEAVRIGEPAPPAWRKGIETTASSMTAPVFRTALNAARITQRALAEWLGYASDTEVRRMARGERAVPDGLAAWLERRVVDAPPRLA